MKFEDGDRVKIEPHFWWPDGAIGTVSIQPEFVRKLLEKKNQWKVLREL
ncbi:hypothetical protein ACJJIP_04700 [Microbulbifer sp. VTAC004]